MLTPLLLAVLQAIPKEQNSGGGNGRIVVTGAAAVPVVSQPTEGREFVPEPPPPNPDGSRVAYPSNDSETWVTTDDYPDAAVREERMGTVTLNLAIDVQGKVIGCTVMQTSGSTDLDATACGVIKERARFQPARNRRGRPVVGSYTRRVRWQLPHIPAVMQPSTGYSGTNGWIARIHIETNGIISACEVFGANSGNPPVHYSAEAQICSSLQPQVTQMLATRHPTAGFWMEIRNLVYLYSRQPDWSGTDAGDNARVPSPPDTPEPVVPLPPHVT